MVNFINQRKDKFNYLTYDNLPRFISYYYQINFIKKVNPERILEIGIGNKTVSNYLYNNGFNIETCDIDESLKPDYIADIRNLPFKNNSFNLIMSCEVLEHIPWKDFEIALSELYRISKEYVLISIPFSSIYFEIVMRSKIFNKTVGKEFLDLLIRIPLFFREIEDSDRHEWEIGRKNYPIKMIRYKLTNHFQIIDETRPLLNPDHQFFLLKKI